MAAQCSYGSAQVRRAPPGLTGVGLLACDARHRHGPSPWLRSAQRMALEDTMFGWNEIIVRPESELFVSDPGTTDADSASLFELGADPDLATR
jgi:hypothetical protein